MKNIILWLWQLPQHLLGLLIVKITGAVKFNNQLLPVEADTYLTEKHQMGISLGRYIIIGKEYSDTTEKHERGHSRQSLYLGPLYLIVVGIPSATRNIWQRLFHKKWDIQKRINWYYGSYPEKWADKLGGVVR